MPWGSGRGPAGHRPAVAAPATVLLQKLLSFRSGRDAPDDVQIGAAKKLRVVGRSCRLHIFLRPPRGDVPVDGRRNETDRLVVIGFARVGLTLRFGLAGGEGGERASRRIDDDPAAADDSDEQRDRWPLPAQRSGDCSQNWPPRFRCDSPFAVARSFVPPRSPIMTPGSPRFVCRLPRGREMSRQPQPRPGRLILPRPGSPTQLEPRGGEIDPNGVAQGDCVTVFVNCPGRRFAGLSPVSFRRPSQDARLDQSTGSLRRIPRQNSASSRSCHPTPQERAAPFRPRPPSRSASTRDQRSAIVRVLAVQMETNLEVVTLSLMRFVKLAEFPAAWSPDRVRTRVPKSDKQPSAPENRGAARLSAFREHR